MAATNYTPIQLYYSTTASAAPVAGNLANGELAINITDGKLYYKDNSGTVQVIATKGAGTIGGSTTQIQYNNAGVLAGSAAMTFNNGTNTVTLTTLNLTNALGATYGGTAQSSYTQGDLLYSSATNTLSKLGIGTVDYILTSTGSVPQWSAPSSISVLTATNLAGGSGGSVPYQSAASTTTFLSIGSSNTVMTSSGTAPQWSSSLTGLLSVSSSGITNVSLTSGRVVYSTTGGAQTDSSNLTFNGTTLSAGGFSTTGLSTLVKTVTIGNGNFSGVAVFEPNTPAKLYLGNGIVTDTTSAIGATNATGAIASLAVTPIAATNTSVTYTNAATLYIAGAPSAGTNVTLTNPYALYVAAGNTFLGGNLLFTDNTYDIGANGATRPRNAYFSKIVTAGQGTNNDWQFLAVDYGNASGAGIYDGIYTSSIKAGTYQAFGFDTRYSNAGSWVGSQTTATIVDGYQGNFRVFTNSGLTAGTPYTPEQKLSISATGYTELRGGTAGSNNVFENLRIALIGGGTAYGGSIGQRIVVGDTRQGLYVKGTGSLTLLSQYNIDFLAGQTSVPLAADTGLALRINSNGTVAMGGSTSTSYPLEIFASGSSSTSKNMLNIYYSAAGAAEPTIQFQTANGGIGKLGFITTGASAGQFQLYTADGSAYINRYTVSSNGTQYWYNVGSSSGSTRMTLDATGLGIGRTANSVLDAYYPATSISGVTSYGNALTAQAGTGTLTISGGTGNQRGVAMIINANQNSSFSVPIGANYDNIGLLAATNTTAGSYTNHAVLGFNLSDGPTRAFTAYTTSTGNSQTAMGFNVNYVNASGASAYAYGIYIANNITAASGTAYAFGSDSTAKSYFAGNLGVGTSSPNYALQIGSPGSGTQPTMYIPASFNWDGVYARPATSGQRGGQIILAGHTNVSNSIGYSIAVDNDSVSRTLLFKYAADATTLAGASFGDIGYWDGPHKQFLSGTSQSFVDPYAGTTYPGVVASNGLAAMGIGNAGSTSRITKFFNLNPGNTYTVRVYPSDGTVACTDIRLGSYCSAGSGYANTYFAYGGHVGAYNITTVFNVYSGNTVVSAPTIVSGYIQFTVTVTGGNSGGASIMVDDAGQTAGKTAFIVVV